MNRLAWLVVSRQEFLNNLGGVSVEVSLRQQAYMLPPPTPDEVCYEVPVPEDDTMFAVAPDGTHWQPNQGMISIMMTPDEAEGLETGAVLLSTFTPAPQELPIECPVS